MDAVRSILSVEIFRLKPSASVCKEAGRTLTLSDAAPDDRGEDGTIVTLRFFEGGNSGCFDRACEGWREFGVRSLIVFKAIHCVKSSIQYPKRTSP